MKNTELVNFGLVAAALLLSSCRPATEEVAAAEGIAEDGGEAHVHGGMEVDGALQGEGPWTATATGGANVTLSSGNAPFISGSVDLEISVHVPDGHATPKSVDLISPTMPVHGIVRYGVSDGVATIDIPMEGRWALYVNLDESGSDSAEFLFDVAPGEGGGHAHGGGASR